MSPGETEKYCGRGIVGEKEHDKDGEIRGLISGRALVAHEEPGYCPVCNDMQMMHSASL